MPLYAFEFLMNVLKKKDLQNIHLLILGVSYRSNVGDTRYSPVESFYNYCVEAGASVSLHDPYVSFWDEKLLKIENDFNSYRFEKFDVVIITTAHQEYFSTPNLIEMLLSYEKLLIFDTIGALDEFSIIKLSEKHKVKVLGRGDL
jgi:UDP-N-acetyl-D-glucosamine dehydrogenase